MPIDDLYRSQALGSFIERLMQLSPLAITQTE
jgi:hypothetical protein